LQANLKLKGKKKKSLVQDLLQNATTAEPKKAIFFDPTLATPKSDRRKKYLLPFAFLH
jgi:hypothetical protein